MQHRFQLPLDWLLKLLIDSHIQWRKASILQARKRAAPEMLTMRGKAKAPPAKRQRSASYTAPATGPPAPWSRDEGATEHRLRPRPTIVQCTMCTNTTPHTSEQCRRYRTLRRS